MRSLLKFVGLCFFLVAQLRGDQLLDAIRICDSAFLVEIKNSEKLVTTEVLHGKAADAVDFLTAENKNPRLVKAMELAGFSGAIHLIWRTKKLDNLQNREIGGNLTVWLVNGKYIHNGKKMNIKDIKKIFNEKKRNHEQVR